MSRLSELAKVGVVEQSAIMGDSDFFKNRFNVTTSLPILNVALSGELEKGFGCGLTMLAGESGTFKTNLALLCLSSYLQTYEDGFGIIYDSEFSITEEYLSTFGIDSSRILYVPICDVEELKQDAFAKLKELKRGEKCFVLIDSVGNMVSRKTITDIQDEKVSTDMSRAKQMKPLFSLITNSANMLDIPVFIVNHSYSTQELYSKTVVSGGRAAMYVPNTVLNMSRRAERSADKSLEGFSFTIEVMKSRFIRAFSRLSFTVNFDSGIDPNSGLLELASDGGFITQKGGWYQLVDSGTPVGNKLRESQLLETGFYDTLLKNTKFNDYVKSQYLLNSGV
jgi:RecA/RadA recombinase